jgi:DNA-binding protein HU-beta
MSATLDDGTEVRIANFGTFLVARRGAREGRNPRSGEAMTITPSTSVKFKPSKALKERAHN